MNLLRPNVSGSRAVPAGGQLGRGFLMSAQAEQDSGGGAPLLQREAPRLERVPALTEKLRVGLLDAGEHGRTWAPN